MAAKSVQQEAKPAVQPEVQKEAKPERKMYEIRLFKDNNKYKEPVYVGVNGRGYLIQRGETVMVPEEVKEVLENSMKQDEYTAKLIDRESGAFEAESRKRNL